MIDQITGWMLAVVFLAAWVTAMFGYFRAEKRAHEWKAAFLAECDRSERARAILARDEGDNETA